MGWDEKFMRWRK